MEKNISDRSDEVQLEHSLVKAAANGNYDQVVQLLNSGVSVDAEEYNKLLLFNSKNYATPLQIAAANGHDKCVQILIDYGADVNAKDRSDLTALHMAAEKGNFLCVKALLEASADCCAPTNLSKKGRYKAVPHLSGTTPLHLAAANNHVDCVKELILYGADCNAVNVKGHTSLYLACKYGFNECALAHLKNDLGRDILSLPSVETSDTPLHFAVSHGMIDCVKELLHLGSDVNHINRAGYSPLHLALFRSNEKISDQLELVKLLVLEGYNTDINSCDENDFTPLHYVCFNGYRNMWVRRPELAKFLISYGANVNISNHLGFTVLENELKMYGETSDILKYIMKSMLHLPHLNSFWIETDTEEDTDTEELEDEILENAMFDMQDEGMETFLRNMHTLRNMHALLPNMNALQNMRVIRNMRALLPFGGFNVIPRPERSQLLRQRTRYTPYPVYDPLSGMVEERYQPPTVVDAENKDNQNQPTALEKQEWYKKIASNPRPLQHHCRYVIRSYMGPEKLKYIERLPIPNEIKFYLLLESEK